MEEVITLNKVDSKEWLKHTAESEREHSKEVLKDEMLQSIGEWGLDYLLYKHDDKIIGRCTIGYNEERESNYIYGLVIVKEYRGKGYGTKFMEYIINKYKDIGFQSRFKEMEHIASKLNIECVDTEKIGDFSNQRERVYKANGS